ncbi:MAG: hypothetical protein A2096_10960 [Spirochaetes bacterium GWF1_41_5]|nr:MAG: hypothetical protein A2096_10960 [Spirochaetes bacterium GWF1_41_5]HBE01737.1 GTPase ObgE [Spirochaetia bacterium]
MEKFIDRVEISAQGGHGGAGAVSFHREKYVEYGGPDGGDGGKGGNIIIKADRRTAALGHIAPVRIFKAENGHPGGSRNCHGANGNDLIINVPAGTVIHTPEGSILADLNEDSGEYMCVRGGRGGKGNAHFATSRNQTPKFSQKGMEGDKADLILEIKLIADIGLVGLPNAGKSTLLSRLTKARPKIADYPFTTLTPHLGVLKLDISSQVIIADIPGIIEGAHRGAGLGIEFLRHIERTFFLFFCIDIMSEDPEKIYLMLRSELEQWSSRLAAKPFAVLITKTDSAPDSVNTVRACFPPGLQDKLFFISSSSGAGLEELKKVFYHVLELKTGQ